AFLLYRSGTENGIEAAKASLDQVNASDFNFASDYQVQPYNYHEVEAWVQFTQEVNDTSNFT
ncbi:hypothetical protein KIV40_26695, partial [Vibrio sp. D173a]|nr:hypothetical protein [Vibrio sp. D173a]